MKASELRIGNWVQTNEYATNEEAGAQLEVSGLGLDVDFFNGTTQIPAAINGIPLTEELLKKFGFKLAYAAYHNEQLIFNKGDFQIEFNKGKTFVQGQECKCQMFVHDLKNIFYYESIIKTGTGEELKLNQ